MKTFFYKISNQLFQKTNMLTCLLFLQVCLRLYYWFILNRHVSHLWLNFTAGLPGSVPALLPAIALYAMLKKSKWLNQVLAVNLILAVEMIFHVIYVLFPITEYTKISIYTLPNICQLALSILISSFIIQHLKQKQRKDNTPVWASEGRFRSLFFCQTTIIITFIITFLNKKPYNSFNLELLTHPQIQLYTFAIGCLLVAARYLQSWANVFIWIFFLEQFPAMLEISSLLIRGRLTLHFFTTPIIVSSILFFILGNHLWKDRERPILPLFRG